MVAVLGCALGSAADEGSSRPRVTPNNTVIRRCQRCCCSSWVRPGPTSAASSCHPPPRGRGSPVGSSSSHRPGVVRPRTQGKERRHASGGSTTVGDSNPSPNTQLSSPACSKVRGGPPC